jgi:ring-1,2-phenylacetyl-CoA epoxidase subunit PaaD
LVERVVDPEIPVLTIADLGILRHVEESGDRVQVTITPTYSGCPAMRQIENDIVDVLSRGGFDATVMISQHPPWSSSWITEEGRRKLESFGIAPPSPLADARCPRCRAGSARTVNEFGSTACKALMVCRSCGEPFDLFKEI